MNSPVDAQSRQNLRLLLVAGPHHLAGQDLRGLMEFLQDQRSQFDLSLSIADPQKQPELLELHRLVATPALVKLEPRRSRSSPATPSSNSCRAGFPAGGNWAW